MDNNYTPIDVNKLEKKDGGLNTILLVIVTLTALVLAILLFVLIQKKIKQTNQPLPNNTVLPTMIVPTVVPTEIVPTEDLISPAVSSATPTIIELSATPTASPSGIINQE